MTRNIYEDRNGTIWFYTEEGISKCYRSDFHFNIRRPDLFVTGGIVSENKNIRRSHLMNMRNLFSVLDMNNYVNDREKLDRIQFITKGLEARLEFNLRNAHIIIVSPTDMYTA